MPQNQPGSGVTRVLLGIGVCTIAAVGIGLFVNRSTPTPLANSGKVPATSTTASAAPPAANFPRWQRDDASRAAFLQKAAPPIEAQRSTEEAALPPAEKDSINLAYNFEACSAMEATKLSPTHFEFSVANSGLRNWFLFRVTGAAGKTVRFDLANPNMVKWWSLNPVCVNAPDVSDPDLYFSKEIPSEPVPAAKTSPAYSGVLLPDTSDQKWHFIPDVWPDGKKLCFTYRFEQDVAYVAFRYPLTPACQDKFIDQLPRSPELHVHRLGNTDENRPLTIVQIGDGGADKPCVVISARDHSCDQDAGWVANGAIRYLLSSSAEAVDIRNRFNFLIIPMINPDAAARGNNSEITFSRGGTVESNAYARFFVDWVNKNRRLDLAVILYSVESAESPHFACPAVDPEPSQCEFALAHFDQVMQLCAGRITVNPKPWGQQVYAGRFNWWLTSAFGTVAAWYMPNGQDSKRHLSLSELQDIGRILVVASVRQLDSASGKRQREIVDAQRAARARRFATFRSQLQPLSPLEAEIVSLRLSAATTQPLPPEGL